MEMNHLLLGLKPAAAVVQAAVNSQLILTGTNQVPVPLVHLSYKLMGLYKLNLTVI